MREARRFQARPLLATFASALVILASLISFYLSNATVQYRVALYEYEQYANPLSEGQLCRFLNAPVGPECDRAVEEELRGARQFLREVSELYPLGHVALDPVGVGGMVAGLMASLVGAVAVSAIAAAHVAGEWTYRTIRIIVAKDPRRARFVLARFGAVWAAGIGLLLAAWAVLALAGPLLRLAYEAPPPAGIDPGGYAIEQVLRAVVALGFFAAVGTALAVVIRNPLGTLGAMLAFIFLALIASAWRTTFRASPATWIGAWMGFLPERLWGDHVWVDQFPLVDPDPALRPDPAVALVALVATGGLALALAALHMRRADVGG